MDTRTDTPVDRLENSPDPASPLPEEGAGTPGPRAPAVQEVEPNWTDDDALAEFPTESEVPRDGSIGLPSYLRPQAVWRIAAGVGLLVLIVVAAWRWWPARGATATETGTIAVETTPPGAVVMIDGRERGKTPLTLPLSVGNHALTIIRNSARRDLSVSVVAATQVVHHVDLTEAPPAKTGRLQVTGAAGAPIALDGVRRGVSPAELTDLPAGDHTVTVGEGMTAVTQRVSIPAGGSASVLVPLAQRGQAAAWISVVAPIELQVFDGDTLIGSSTTNRILLLAGRHTLNLANRELGYRAARDVYVEAGRVVTVPIQVPSGVLHVNATPWAEVLLDGKRLGETPLGNVAVPIGAHELTLRNPKFPEQKRSIVISLVGPTRVGVDLRQ